MSGPSRKPPELRAFQGGRVRRDSAHGMLRPEDLAKTDAPVTVPDWISPRERVVWDELYALLSPLGLVTAADVHMLALLCTILCQLQDAVKAARVGPLIQADGRLVRNPATAAMLDLAARYQAIAGEFGLTPGTRLSKAKGGGDALDKLLKLEVG